jgi:homoserine kinase type II
MHCALAGEALVKLHAASAGFSLSRPNALSITGWRKLAQQTAERANSVQPGLAEMIRSTLDELSDWPRDLPEGVIHADLFPDNVLFVGGRISGLIDFYFACNDALAYDLAVMLNAWCFEQDGSFNITKGKALLAAYRQQRDLSKAEIDALPVLARGAALRFLLTRLYDWLNPDPSALVRPKDPRDYIKRLRFHNKVKSASEYGL